MKAIIASFIISTATNMTAQTVEFKFSEAPFSSGDVKTKTEFKAGDYLYGRVYLDKKLIDLTQSHNANEVAKITLFIAEKGTGRFAYRLSKRLAKGEFESDKLDFDIYPEKEKASDDYGSVGFFYSLMSGEIHDHLPDRPGNKITFEITLQGHSYEGWKEFQYTSEITIDYSGVDSEKLQEMKQYGFQACKEGEANFDKKSTQMGAELAKSLPLPNVFKEATGHGYKTYSDAALIEIIKGRFNVSEVYQLCYWPTKDPNDFTLYKENGLTHSQWGNVYFYFIFKDPIDGFYKATGGVLVKPYIGGGVFGEPYIHPATPILESDTHSFPHDRDREKLGYESVFFVDGAKVKK